MPTFTVDDHDLSTLAQGLAIARAYLANQDGMRAIVGHLPQAARTALATDLTDLMRRLGDNGNNYEPWEDRTCGGCQLAARMRSNGGKAGCADHEQPEPKPDHFDKRPAPKTDIRRNPGLPTPKRSKVRR